ncbi:MAG TPA: PaaI family thioesterase [Gemmataceae bacterium]|nr:PaaI family thioesterase [Gemmataceae bacterium]
MTTMFEQGQKLLRGELSPPPIARLLGFALKSIEPGHAVFEMEVDERYYNPMGTLHGGVYCDLADAAMGYAYASLLGPGETFTTIELKINFLRAVQKTTLVADAKVIKAGSTLGYIECDVKDLTGKLVARVASTCMKLNLERKPGTSTGGAQAGS